jgi:hypothetical protein
MEENLNSQNQGFQTSEQSLNKKPFINIVLIGIFLVVLIIAGILYFASKTRKKGVFVNKVPTVTPIISPVEEITKSTKGVLTFRSEEDNFEINKPFSLIITADSAQEQVVGMDILIKFDKNKLKLLSTHSLQNQFSIYHSTVDDYLNLTLVKNLNANDPVYFSQTKIVELQFLPLIKGNTYLELIQELKNRKTFFVNEKSEIFFLKLPGKLLINIK